MTRYTIATWDETTTTLTGDSVEAFRQRLRGKRIRATYGLNYDRLVEIKKIYDPSNVFRSNRNIPPPAQDGRLPSPTT